MTQGFRAPHRLAAVAAALAVLVGVAACGDLTKPKPQYANFTDTVTVFAINGTPIEALAGIHLIGGLTSSPAVPVDGSFSFDLAFDIDGQGSATMYTVRKVAGGLSTAHSVGLQRVQNTFDALEKAPTNGFVSDTSFVVAVGNVFAVVSSDPGACGFSLFSNQLYAKLEILGVDLGPRTVRARFTVNPNCGFLSLIPSGVPKD